MLAVTVRRGRRRAMGASLRRTAGGFRGTDLTFKAFPSLSDGELGRLSDGLNLKAAAARLPPQWGNAQAPCQWHRDCQ
jgi:hypothetical protein